MCINRGSHMSALVDSGRSLAYTRSSDPSMRRRHVTVHVEIEGHRRQLHLGAAQALVRDDLATQARCRSEAGGEVEHVFLPLRGLLYAVVHLLREDDVTSRASD